MGDWGGAPPGWVPPEERKEREAAAEAAAAMEARRAQADERNAELAGAIRDGLGMVAAAIVAASDHPANFGLERFDQIWSGFMNADDPGPGPQPPDTFGEGAFASPDFMRPPVPADPEVDDLLAADDDEHPSG